MTMRDKISRLTADAERWCRGHSKLQKELEAAQKRIAALEAERDRLHQLLRGVVEVSDLVTPEFDCELGRRNLGLDRIASFIAFCSKES
jgi:predicted nuclease with TOPRIM domain